VNEAGYSYVFKKSGRGLVRQMVETGAMNDNEIVVKRGLSAGEQVIVSGIQKIGDGAPVKPQ